MVRSGLVHSQTSGTRLEAAGWKAVDQEENRKRRLRRNVITSARLHQEKNPRAKAAMVTLTYREDVEWKPQQVAEFIKRVREWCRRRGHKFRYVWVHELTKAGRPHYHVLVWLPRGLTLPKPDKQGWWRHGFTRIEWARRAVGYVAKYASKGTADELPRGVRLYGVGGLDEGARNERAWWNLPVYVRNWGNPSARWRRAPGGGFASRVTGEWRPSEWVSIWYGGRIWIAAKSDIWSRTRPGPGQ